MLLPLLLIIGGLLVLGATVFLSRSAPKVYPENGYHLYRQKRLMSPAELEFWSQLKKAVPEYTVIPQVAVGALIQVGLPTGHPLYFAIWDQFSRLIVDYCVLNSRGKVVLLIEVATPPELAAKAAKQDALALQAGYPTLRIPGRNLPTSAQVRVLILQAAIR